MATPIAAIQQSAHPVQGVQQRVQTVARAGLPPGARWDDVQTFLAVAHAGSFRKAAIGLNVAVNTVRSRTERLEAAMAASLFTRSLDGVSLTDAGARLLALASRMEGEARHGGPSGPDHRLVSAGELRIGTSEAIGSGWLTPRLMDLHARFPELTVSLLCDYDIQSDRSDEIDIGIAWYPPTNPNLVVAKLATFHFMAFASRGYIAEMGVPTTMDDLLRHRFIEQVAPGVKSNLLDQMVGLDRPPGFLPIRTNSSLALFWAVVSGAGIAFMPTYALAVTKKLVPIDLPFRMKFDILYYYHPAARNSQPVRATIDWLHEIFDAKRYPWFRSEFVHPSEFQSDDRGENVIRLFEPFVGEAMR